LASLEFQLDEHIDSAIANGLRRAGIGVVTTAEAGLLGASDIEQLAHALSARRVLVTHDQGFTRLHHQGLPHSGIAYSKHGSRTIRQIVDALILLDEVYDPEEMVGRLEYL
jgi:hypothetical protein